MKTFTGQIIVFIAVGLLVLGGLTYWFLATPSQSLKKYAGPVEKITVSTSPDAKSALIYLAQHNGFFSENGLEVTLKVFQSGKMGFEQAKAGKVDIANAAEFVLVDQIFAGTRSLRCLGAIAEADDHYLITLKERGILAPSDLRGKKVGVPRGTTAEFFLGRFLSFNHLALREVEIIAIQPTDLGDTLAQGRVDAVMVWEQWAEKIKKQLRDKIVSWPGQSGQKYFWLLVATDGLVKTRPGVLERMFSALHQAEIFLKKNREASIEIVARQTNLDPAIVKTALSRNRCALSFDQSLFLSMEDEARWMIRNKMTSETRVPNYLEYMNAEALSRVTPQAVNLILPKHQK